MAKTRTTTSPKQWKKRVGGEELALPSGNVCRVKRPGMQEIMKAGIMPDSLTPIALEHIERAERSGRPTTKAEDEAAERDMMKKLMSDQSAISDIFDAFDRVTVMCVVEPKVRLQYYTQQDINTAAPQGAVLGELIPEEDRDGDMLYADEVDTDDKMFIFNFAVGGSSDLESFREEHDEHLEALDSVSEPEVSTQ